MPSGPCIICGAVNYAPSYGGPNICPPCDCGPPNPVEVRKLREAYHQLPLELAVFKTYSCPCPALPEGCVVVRKKDLQQIGDASGWDCDTLTYNRLKTALEKMP